MTLWLALLEPHEMRKLRFSEVIQLAWDYLTTKRQSCVMNPGLEPQPHVTLCMTPFTTLRYREKTVKRDSVPQTLSSKKGGISVCQTVSVCRTQRRKALYGGSCPSMGRMWLDGEKALLPQDLNISDVLGPGKCPSQVPAPP